MNNPIPNEVYTNLSLQFKKGESITYVKQLCSTISAEQMEDFTSRAMMIAYQRNRPKALDYMLGLEERHEASLLVKIHTQRMMFDQEDFEKCGNIFAVICKHFKRTDILEQLEKCRTHKSYDNAVQDRYKELSFFVFKETVEEKNIKTKVKKI